MERELDGKKGLLQHLVDEAKRGLQLISPEVVNWFETEAEIQGRLKDLHEKLDAKKKSIRARRKLSIQLIKMVAKVRNLCEKEFSVIGLDQPHPAVLVNRTSSTKVNVHSRELIMDEVMKGLEDDTISSIGVHGMGGIGKTTLMNNVNSKLQESQLFKKVIMVTVSKEPDVKVLQDRIAERLDLKFDQSSAPSVRANKLFERLKAEESVLLILDDIWERLDTAAIGVPSSSEHSGCKVLLTTRDLNVCRQMQVQKTIKMDILNDEESWMIFEEKVGNAVNFPNLQVIAKEIVQRCNGSPLAIAVLGSALRDKAEYEWIYALRVLQNPNATGLEGIMPEVVASLRWSYDHLSSQNLQLCFLHCCMFAEDENISVYALRNFGIGDGFLSMTATMEDATIELLYFVKTLKDRSLLLDGYNERSVKMHDVVRDVAMLIASEGNYGFFVSAGGALPESLSAYKRISMIQNKEYLISNPLECPKLSTLIIDFQPESEPELQPKIQPESEPEIQPESEPTAEHEFFLGCPALRILIMVYPPLVPKSISQLTNLRTLHLEGCDLRNKVYLLGGLTKLQVLVLNESNLGELVEEFGNLRNLRVLGLIDAEINYIAPGIFSRLSKLEELSMVGSFKGKWGSVGPEGKPNAGFVEVTTLVHLSILYIQAEAVEEKVMSNLLWLNKLKQFNVALNSSDLRFWEEGNSVSIEKANHGNNMSFANSTKNIRLFLNECYGFKGFTRFEGFSQLRSLEVKKCDEIEYLIDGGFSNNSFKSLEELNLTQLRGMKNILRGETSSTSLGRLRQIIITECPNITTVFPASLLLPRLEKLEDVRVYSCALLQNIFNTEGEGGLAEGPESNSHGASLGEGLLSGIRSIFLSDLPEMTSIWKGVVPSGSLQGLIVLSVKYCSSLIYLLLSDMVRCLQNLENICVDDCSKMEKLIFNKEGGKGLAEGPESNTHGASPGEGLLPGIHSISLSDLPEMTSIWKGVVPSGSLQGLRSLRVIACHSLRYLLSSDMVRCLQNLEDICVDDCSKMEKLIFNKEGGKGLAEGPESNTHGASPGEGLLPGIHSISLSDLPEMTSIWKGVVPSGSLQGLRSLRVIACHSLRYLLSSDMVRCLQNLEDIYVYDCSKMEKLIHFTCEEAKETVCLAKLRYIRITDCPNIIPSHLHFLEERHKSHELKVVGNDALKHIYSEIPWSYQFPSIKITFESFFLLEEGLRSDNSSLQLTATTQFKEMHTIGWDESTIEEVIKSGVLSRFVDFVFRDDFPELQYEAVSFLANLVSSGTSDFVKVVIHHGVVPIFVELLSSKSDDIIDQALRALGNIAGRSSDLRDLVLEHGTLTPLLVQLNDHTKISILRKAMFALHKIFICKPQPPFEQMKIAVPVLVRLMHSNDETVYADACWVFFYLSNGVGDDIQILIEADVVPGLVRLLQHSDPSVLIPALRTIADIIRKDSMQIQCILDHQVLPYLLNVLIEFNHMENIQKAAFSIISCITAGSEMQIQAVITANIIGLLIQQSKPAEFDIKKEAVWAVTNAICGGSSKQIKDLVSLGCITPICDLLVCPDAKLVVACLQAIDKILSVGKTEIPIGNDGVLNIYKYLIGVCGGLEKIKNLRGHEISKVHEKAVNILKIYWLQEGALPCDDKFAQADFQYGENELPVPSGPLNEASRPSFPMGVVKDFERGMEQCEEWKMGLEIDLNKPTFEEVTIGFWSAAYAKELEGGMEERESEQDTMPSEIDLNKSPSEDGTIDSWSKDAYKTNAREWKCQDLNFEFGSTSEDVTITCSNNAYKTNARDWKSQYSNFEFGSTSEDKESADELTSISTGLTLSLAGSINQNP